MNHAYKTRRATARLVLLLAAVLTLAAFAHKAISGMTGIGHPVCFLLLALLTGYSYRLHREAQRLKSEGKGVAR